MGSLACYRLDFVLSRAMVDLAQLDALLRREGFERVRIGQ
jgi:hypothetical protein